MSEGLDDLFQQILHSEKKAQERKNLLNEVKANIVKCAGQVREVRERADTLQGCIVLQMQQLVDQETQLKGLASRAHILQNQRESLHQEKGTLSEKIAELKAQLEDKRQDFVQQVRAFSKEYDLCSNGKQHREQAAKVSVQLLIKQQQQLEQELADYKVHRDQILGLHERKINLQYSLAEKKKPLHALCQEYNKEKLETKKLGKCKEQVANIPCTGSEFKRLQQELEGCKDEGLEGLCSALQQQLQQLQQQQWQQELQRKQSLQQQQRAARSMARQTEPKQSNTKANTDVTAAQQRSNKQVFSNYTTGNGQCSNLKKNTSLQIKKSTEEMDGVHNTAWTKAGQNQGLATQTKVASKHKPNINKLTKALKNKDTSFETTHTKGTAICKPQNQLASANQGKKAQSLTRTGDPRCGTLVSGFQSFWKEKKRKFENTDKNATANLVSMVDCDTQDMPIRKESYEKSASTTMKRTRFA